MLWTSYQIARAIGGAASADFAVSGVAFDSREIGAGDLFVAMKGEADDGHRFVAQAFEKGAAGAVVSEAVEGPHVLAADTTAALEALGKAARARTQAKVIGVTGSVGKTGTKEALYAALERGAPDKVHRSVKSYNNHTGVPLSLARMPAQTEFGVFEMGMNHAGELARLTRQVRPHVAIVTTVAPAHQEFFASVEAIADAKGEIFEGLEPGGTAIVPFDGPHRYRLLSAARRYADRVWTFGTGDGADVRALDAVPATGGGTLVTAKLPGGELCFTVAQPGAHWVANALAVIAAVEAVGGDLAAAGLALAEMEGLKGRGARHRIVLADGEALLIDESYNANPASMMATLAELGATKAERRIAVLGAMRELGRESSAFHAALADPLERASVDFALLVGEEMRALEPKGEFAHVPDAAAALEALREMLRPGDAVLVKGSNSMGLSAIVDALTSGARG